MVNKVSLFSHLKSTKTVGNADVDTMLNVISNKNAKHVDKVNKFRKSRTKDNKYKIPVVTWSGVFKQRSNSNVVSFSDHIYCDFDNVNPIDAKNTLSHIKEIRAAWTSVSGEGVGALIKTENINKNNFKSTVKAIHEYIEQYDLHTDVLTDIARCNFVSYDTDIYVNNNAEIYKPVEPDYSKLKRIYSDLVNDEKEYNNTACNISMAYSFKKGLDFSVGSRHNFTVTYFGMCNIFGVPIEYAYQFALENNCVSQHTYKKAEKLYKHWSNQHGIKEVWKQ